MDGDVDSCAVKIMGCSNPVLPEIVHAQSCGFTFEGKSFCCAPPPLHPSDVDFTIQAVNFYPSLVHAGHLAPYSFPIANAIVLGSDANSCTRDFICITDRILSNHSGIGIKIFNLRLFGVFDACPYLDKWLQIAVKPGIEKLRLELCGEELECFISNSTALEQLDLCQCNEIIHLKIPHVMQQLSNLVVDCCYGLRLIESEAQNLSSPSYDYFSLASFLDASPSLETLILDVTQHEMKHKSVFDDLFQLRQMPDHRLGCLKTVKIKGFSSAKGLIELICYTVKNAESLDCLTLDTLCGTNRCYLENSVLKHCDPMSKGILKEAPRAVKAIRTYIEDKVPSTVKLTVLEPCSRCHANGGFQILVLGWSNTQQQLDRGLWPVIKQNAESTEVTQTDRALGEGIEPEDCGRGGQACGASSASSSSSSSSCGGVRAMDCWVCFEQSLYLVVEALVGTQPTA
ncbi:hypothetical protein PR202_ga30904 [Eleusine coracana subsp. coracana]|uniref:At1g61320/AtMIF1 LRR domain-containing protein n=1 Tax=Eleusine coracana subsp. coracana TaxID=191504 RepID=A0AAV5DR65_ELECO|nr:hypothetical protein PR202_ga30904 [Eleusine coracana subsp. coracana]